MEPLSVGEIVISATDGSILNKPRYFDVRDAIRSYLEFIRDTVEKILVKVGASNFSRLPFPTHMHSPVVDVLSWLLANDRLDLSEVLAETSEDRRKYMDNVASLGKLGLVILEGSIVQPTDILIEIEARTGSLNESLSRALTVFFERRFNMLDSVRQVLGPHLAIAGNCYRESMEYGDLLPFSFERIERGMLETYKERMRIKIPRYLAQLEDIGLLEETRVAGQTAWIGKQDVLNRMYAERELFTSAASYLMER